MNGLRDMVSNVFEGLPDPVHILLWNLATLQNLDVIAKNRFQIRIQQEKMNRKQQSYCLLVARNRFYVKNKPEKECEITPFLTSGNAFRDISRRPLIRFQKFLMQNLCFLILFAAIKFNIWSFWLVFLQNGKNGILDLATLNLATLENGGQTWKTDFRFEISTTKLVGIGYWVLYLKKSCHFVGLCYQTNNSDIIILRG